VHPHQHEQQEDHDQKDRFQKKFHIHKFNPGEARGWSPQTQKHFRGNSGRGAYWRTHPFGVPPSAETLQFKPRNTRNTRIGTNHAKPFEQQTREGAKLRPLNPVKKEP
jgi:hypothetical protein